MRSAHSHALRKDDAPRDLRSGDGSDAGAGKFYPVHPCAATRLKIILAKGSSSRKTKGANVKTNDVVDVSIYPEAVVAAARIEAAKPDKRARRYGDVFTPEVVAIWQEWKANGRSLEWIGQNNGLIEVPVTVVHTYMFKHKSAAANLRSQENCCQDKGEDEGGTAVPAVSREVRQETVEESASVTEVELPALDEVAATDAQPPVQAVEPVPTKPDNLPAYLDRDHRPVPRVGDTLGNLIRLLNDERVQIEGEVDLKLKIKFGGK